MRPLLPSLARGAARREVSRIVDAFELEATDGLEHESSTQRLAAIASLSTLVDAAEARLCRRVAEARRAGATWSSIGDAFGVSRQAAQQRFGEPRTCVG